MKRFRLRFLAVVSILFFASSAVYAAPAPNTKAAKVASLDADRRLLAYREMWLLAVAVEEYAVDHQAYPVPGPEPISTSRLAGFLAPTYLPVVPVRDPWCSDYLYWSNGTDYIIASFSSDAASDFSYSSLAKKGYHHLNTSVCTGSSEAPGADILFADGMFCRWHSEKPVDPWR